MKKLIIVLCCLMGSCTTIEQLKPATSGEALSGDYQLLDNKKTFADSWKIYFCFVPIGGKSEEALRIECLNKMLSENSADGVFLPYYTYTAIRYPFYLKYKMELQGRPYKLKQK